jgi:hypothetical protein
VNSTVTATRKEAIVEQTDRKQLALNWTASLAVLDEGEELAMDELVQALCKGSDWVVMLKGPTKH